MGRFNHKKKSAKALAPYTTFVNSHQEMGAFFDKMDLLEPSEIMKDLFEDVSWEGFRLSGYYPYNFGFISS